MLEELYGEIYRMVQVVLWRTAIVATAFIVWFYGYFYFAGTELPPIVHGVIFTGSLLAGIGLGSATMLVQWTWRYVRSQF